MLKKQKYLFIFSFLLNFGTEKLILADLFYPEMGASFSDENSFFSIMAFIWHLKNRWNLNPLKVVFEWKGLQFEQKNVLSEEKEIKCGK